MIMIIGSQHDDILYFERALFNRREEIIFNRFKAYIGSFFNQECLVIGDMYSSTLTSAVMTYILNKYYVDLIIVVGKCYGVDKSTKNGDLVISSKIIDVNVDLSEVKEVGIGQIPGFQKEFPVQVDIIKYLKQGVSKRSYVASYNAVYLSSDNLSEENKRILSENRGVFGITDEKIVLDFNSSGAALAGVLKDIPFVSIKVVEHKFNVESNINNYLNVLDRYIDLGKAVVSTIGDIGRNDVLRGGVGNEYKE